MVLEAKVDFVLKARSQVSVIATPLHWATNLPSKIFSQASTTLAQRESLLQENSLLKEQNLKLSKSNQKLANLTKENQQLKSLLKAKNNIKEDAILGEIVGLGYHPSVQEVIINRGQTDGLHLGQPIVDAYGLMAVVASISPYSSRAILISDTSVSIPVQINRNSARFILAGAGKGENMILNNVARTSDIKSGDLLITSGLAGRFPFGYPVAVVDKIEDIEGEPFLKVNAKPIAKLETSRYVLLISHTISGIKPEDLIKIGEQD